MLLNATLLEGGDLANGTVNGTTPADCCAACGARPDCGGWSLDPALRQCYLKNATGWTRKPDPAIQSWFGKPLPSECQLDGVPSYC